LYAIVSAPFALETPRPRNRATARPHHGPGFATLASDTGEAFLIVEKKHTENFTILYVEGLIKLGESAEFFSAALENVLKNESTNVIIDFTKIDYIDSTGIGELVGYLGKFTSQNRTLILVNPSERILKLLKLAKLDAVFKIYNTEEEAISAESNLSS
jgi:anti-sigma B factor antagonist